MNNENIKLDIGNNLSENTIKEIRGIKSTDIDKIFHLCINDKFKKYKDELMNKNDYEYLIEILNKFNEEEFIIFMGYLNNINIILVKILINNYIELDFEDEKKEQEENILNVISKAISIYYNKEIFYYIYGKLSIIYRRKNSINLKKFEKLFKIWKLLYNIEPYFQNIQNNENLFFYCTDKVNNIKIDFGKKVKNGALNSYFITINFIPSLLLNINKFVPNIAFMVIFDDHGKKFKNENIKCL